MDLCAVVDDMESTENVDVSGWKAHRGILKAAQRLKAKLEKHHLLELAFSEHQDYKLVITGHSLGAGVASLLALLLRPVYKELQCFAYSPPGWLVSLPLSRYADDFICSVVLASDLVPRMGLVNFERLKLHMIQVIRDSNEPKYRILASGFWRALFGEDILETVQQVEDLSVREPLLSDVNTPTNQRVRRYTVEESTSEGGVSSTSDRAILSDATIIDMMQASMPAFVSCPLYMAGQVLYLDELSPASTIMGTPSYRVAWARPEHFDEILVGVSMVTDHMPSNVYKALVAMTEKNIELPRYRVVGRATSCQSSREPA